MEKLSFKKSLRYMWEDYEEYWLKYADKKDLDRAIKMADRYFLSDGIRRYVIKITGGRWQSLSKDNLDSLVAMRILKKRPDIVELLPGSSYPV